MKDAQVHRFGDSVALSVGTGETVYMTRHEAKFLGEQLIQFAKDVSACKFTNSPCGTFRMEFTGEIHNQPKVVRDEEGKAV